MPTILVIDDSALVVAMIQSALERSGYQVIIANDGREGVECMRTAAPDLVICDLMMPVMGGREVVRWMRSHAPYDTVPLILMSAVDHIEGDVPFLVKPFTMPLLLETVNSLLPIQPETTPQE